jgi:hypothetical protein
MNAQTNGASTTLREEHVRYLAARAVPIEVALEAGLYSAEREQVAALLGLPNVPSGGLVIPYQRLGEYVRVRMDDGGARFLIPPGAGAPIYAPPENTAGGPLLVTEGPIKALAVVAAGHMCVGLAGAQTGLTNEAGEADRYRIGQPCSVQFGRHGPAQAQRPPT